MIPLLAASAYSSPQAHEHPEWQEHFQKGGYSGSMLIHNRADSSWHVFNRAHSETAFLPCSTFKIPNSLIALETGVAPDEKLIIPWDGVKRRETWNRDMTMAEAIAVSNLPYYQEIARRIGRARMQKYVDKLNYGNRDISGPIDQFWLSGKLRINQWQQVEFLENLDSGKLPFSPRSMEIVKRITITDDKTGYRIHSKTGLGYVHENAVAWWVGWVERTAGPCYFALNLGGKGGGDTIIPARRSIGIAILNQMGIVSE